MNIKNLVENLEDKIIEYRRYLHRHPELSKKEFKTQTFIKKILDENNITYDVGATTGVIGYINKNKRGKCVGLRADIDALPIYEENNMEYKSKNDGVMHACGHDAHTAILLGVGIALNKIKEEINGCVKLIFQPDEEVSSGAKVLIKEGVMDNPKIDYILGLHVMPYLEVGEIEVKNGTLNASSSKVEINVYGKSAHAAYPNMGVDTILVASSIVMNLQSVISRNISPLDQAVLSFGTIEGGIKTNIIPNHVKIKGTLRTVNNESRELIKNRINKIVKNTALAYNAKAECFINDGYPHLINNINVNKHIIENAKNMDNIKLLYKELPSMGAEDFGYYQKHALGAFFHLGAGNKSIGIISGLHTSTFNIDERCLKIGVELQVRNVISLLKD